MLKEIIFTVKIAMQTAGGVCKYNTQQIDETSMLVKIALKISNSVSRLLDFQEIIDNS